MARDTNYKKLFAEFNRLSILIIGDVMVDSYLWGKVERISPEAPIPIVALKKRENRMGGAANVAMNIRSMGARPVLCSVIGTDDKGDTFLSLLKKEKIGTHGIVRSPGRITTTKFRIFGNNTQMLRVDEEVEHDLLRKDQEHLLNGIVKILDEEKINCIIFQDYNKGVITRDLIRKVVTLARQKNIPVTVDPKKKNFEAYEGITLFKPNLKELREGMKTDFSPDYRDELIKASQALRLKLNCEYVLTTLSEHGVMISLKDNSDDKNIFVPAHMRSIADVSGAGDTVISVASLCLSMKCTPYEIAYISNLAGGLVCEEVGVVPVNKEKLLKEVLALL
ncbi:MAG TPA: bifunctional ADP-heptose synthase [Bacteroidales bacterium]|nr:bifunctional ADP-heptose synthase [Bacteroidales bacterium]